MANYFDYLCFDHALIHNYIYTYIIINTCDKCVSLITLAFIKDVAEFIIIVE